MCTCKPSLRVVCLMCVMDRFDVDNKCEFSISSLQVNSKIFHHISMYLH